MSTLAVTAQGQVTFRRSVMRHLGVKTGRKNRVGTSAGWTGRDQSGSALGQDRRFLWRAGWKKQESRNHRRNQSSRSRRLGGPGQDGRDEDGREVAIAAGCLCEFAG